MNFVKPISHLLLAGMLVAGWYPHCHDHEHHEAPSADLDCAVCAVKGGSDLADSNAGTTPSPVTNAVATLGPAESASLCCQAPFMLPCLRGPPASL